MSSDRLGYQWQSRTGSASGDNQDYAGAFFGLDYTLAIVADGVGSHKKSGVLAQRLVNFIVNKACHYKGFPGGSDVNLWVREARSSLREADLHRASVSYLIAAFRGLELVYTLHAGDCRLGRRRHGGVPVWMTPIHSLATAFHGLPDSALSTTPGRNQLTRVFSCRRIHPAELIQWGNVSGPFLLATDGFWDIWSEMPGSLSGECRDDSSCLVISKMSVGNSDFIQSPNFYSRAIL